MKIKAKITSSVIQKQNTKTTNNNKQSTLPHFVNRLLSHVYTHNLLIII
jgi:hypothetical protein